MVMVAMLAAGAAVWLALPALRVPPETPPAWLWPRWLRARPGGLGWRHRAGIAAVAGLVASLALPVSARVGFAVGVAVAAAALAGSGRLEAASARSRRRRLTDELPRALDLMACVLAAGLPVRTAVREVARVCPPATADLLRLVQASAEIGVSETEAWLQLAQDPLVSPVWGPVARDMARSVSSGTPVAEVLRTHATDARQRRADAIELRARKSGVAAVFPLMVCFLPAFVLVGAVPIVAGTLLNFWW